MKITQPYINGLLATQALDLREYFPMAFHLPQTTESKIAVVTTSNQRLGHFAEELFFVLTRSSLLPNELVLANIQIVQNKVTLGELDMIKVGKCVTHIEFCYKVYLHDPTLSMDEFFCWIGPNRRDSLAQKVEKLKTKQLPLLFEQQTTTLLKEQISNFDQLEKQQAVTFLAQLYVPYSEYIAKANYQYGQPDGFYILISELVLFPNVEWFVPNAKTDWILQPCLNVNWMDQKALKTVLQAHYSRESNPLCWMKDQNGELFKCFIVNW